MRPPDRWDRWSPRLKDVSAFALGLGIVLHEASGQGRLEVMLVGVAIAGLPLPMRADLLRRKETDDE